MGWKDNLRDVEPYVAGEQPKMMNLIKLNTNENPYDPGAKVKEAIASFDSETLRLYPNADSEDLKTALANYYQLNTDQLFIGNGSDEVLALTFLTCFNSEKPLLFPDISYSFYPVYCQLYKIPYENIPLDDHFKINTRDYYRENGGIIFPNPNAPTGELVSVEEINHLLENNQESIVVIDEAYIDFGGESVIPLLEKYENLLIIQTFSKFRSLAGIRLGIALGNKELISKLYDVKNSFNSYPVDRLAQAIGKASVEDSHYIKENADKIIKARENTVTSLKKMGFIMTNSYANFIFISHPDYEGEYLFKELRKKSIIVRWFNQPRIKNYLRVTIGTDEQMDIFLKEIGKIVGKQS